MSSVASIPAGTEAARRALRLATVKLRLLLREPMVAVGMVGFPAATVVVLAGVFGELPDPAFGGVAPSDHYFAGYIGVVVAAMGLMTMPAHIASQRELGVVRRFRASGLSAGVLVASEVVLAVLVATMAVAVILVLGVTLYGLSAPADPLAVLAWYLAGLACFIAIGGALGAVARTGRAAAGVGNLLFVPMLLLGGGGPPRAVMTTAMAAISDVLPLTHVVGGLRRAWLGTGDDPTSLWWPALLATAGLGLAWWTSRRRPD